MTARRNERDTLLVSCLEAARQEVVRRLEERGLPTAVTINQPVIIDNSDAGWRSDYETVSVSALRVPNLLTAIRDESVAFRIIGFREQLLPLADFLHKTTDLGDKQASGFLPEATGPDAILGRYLSGLATQYVAGLGDARCGNQEGIEQAAAELDVLCNTRTARRTYQLTVAGVKVAEPLQMHRNVSLRALTPSERGAVWETQHTGFGLIGYMPDFVVPRPMASFAQPSALLQVTTSRRRTQNFDRSELPNRILLAFYLSGFDLCSLGLLVSFDEPRWASMGISHSLCPVEEKRQPVVERVISQKAFQDVVDLAHKIPSFGGTEAGGREIVLSRTLRGCGATESGFLDFAIALEASLLGGATTELSYRFSLYGALFLKEERDVHETFEKLKNIYSVRSKLVHGTSVASEARRRAEGDAADLAKAVAKKAVLEDWPNRQALDARALGAGGLRDT
jgi:hypothetical protein